MATKLNDRPVIVFDIGGVLIEWDPRHLYRKLFPNDEQAMEYFLAEICSPEWNAQLDAGRPFAKAVRELVQAYPGYTDHDHGLPSTMGGDGPGRHWGDSRRVS